MNKPTQYYRIRQLNGTYLSNNKRFWTAKKSDAIVIMGSTVFYLLKELRTKGYKVTFEVIA